MISPLVGRTRVVAESSCPAAITEKSSLASSSAPGATKSLKKRGIVSDGPRSRSARAGAFASSIQQSAVTQTRGARSSAPAEVARRYGLEADLAAALESIDAWTGAVVDR